MKILLLILIFFIRKIKSQNEKLLYKCGFDKNKIIPNILETKDLIDYNSSLYRRRLGDIDEDGFKKFNIFIDNTNLLIEMEKYNLSKYKDLLITSIDKAKKTLETLLKVKPIEYAYWFSDDKIKDLVDIWDTEKFGNEAHNKNISLLSLGIDLVIFPRFENFTDGTLASAAGRFLINNYKPLAGILNINLNINFNNINMQEYLHILFLHELTHVLGFSNYYFQIFNMYFEREDKYGIKRFYLNSTKVIEAAKQYYNCSDIDGIELENYGGGGTVGSHWEARILLGDYMNGYKYEEEEAISELTLAYLEDTGYYKVNYYTGGLMRFGKNKGCKFIEDKCIIDYNINPDFENEFFNSTYYNNFDPGCTSGRLSRAYRYLSQLADIPEEYQYFPSNTTGGFAPSDYCPISNTITINTNIFSSSCSDLGDGKYGKYIYYPEERKEGNYIITEYKSYNSSQLANITGEKNSDHSFCYLSSLIKKTEEKYEVYHKRYRAVCLETFCSSKSLTVKIHENYILCPRSGGKIEVDEYGGYLICPDYNLICTATTMCNNIDDCINKKSELKKDYVYDYKSKTTQNIERLEDEIPDNETNYELSEDGKCPRYCQQCLENNICIKCKEDYGLVGSKNEEKIICLPQSELNKGHYNDSQSIYYQCIDFCDSCSNGETCNKCINNYFLLNNETDKCYNINDINPIEDYYLDENNSTYYSCQKFNLIKFCQKCSKFNNCFLCQKNYTFINGNKTKCYEINQLGDKYYQDPDDNSNYIGCSNFINNCLSCNNTQCLKCGEGYVFINDDYDNCLLKSSLNLSIFFTNDEIMYYSCEEERYKNNQKCSKTEIESSISDIQTTLPTINEITTTTSASDIQTTLPIINEITTSTSISTSTSSIEEFSDLINTETNIEDSDIYTKTNFIYTESSIPEIQTTINYNDSDKNSIIVTLPIDVISDFNKNTETIISNITESILDSNTNSINIETTLPFLSTSMINIKETTILNSNIPIYTSYILSTNLHETIIDYHNINVDIFFLQAKLTNNKLILFVLIENSFIKENFVIIISIILYTKNLRNLGETSMNITLSPSKDLDEFSTGLISFESDKSFNERYLSSSDVERIKIINGYPENSYNYNFTINNIKNNENLDTLISEENIKSGKIHQFAESETLSENNSPLTDEIYRIKSISKGCNFTIILDKNININLKEFNLYFSGEDNNIITSKCYVISKNNNQINCSFSENVDEKNYTLKNYINYEDEKVILILNDYDDDSYPLICKIRKLSNISIIFIGAIFLIYIIFSIFIIIRLSEQETGKDFNRNIYEQRRMKINSSNDINRSSQNILSKS